MSKDLEDIRKHLYEKVICKIKCITPLKNVGDIYYFLSSKLGAENVMRVNEYKFQISPIVNTGQECTDFDSTFIEYENGKFEIVDLVSLINLLLPRTIWDPEEDEE